MVKSTLEELKKLAEQKKVIFGSNEVIRKLKQGKLLKVITASNIPREVEEDIKNNAGLNKTEIEKVNMPNDEFGTVFKRTHVLLAVGVLKE